MFFIFWTSHGITHTPMPDLVQLSAQFSPEQQLLCFPKQRVARGKESVSNPSPNNTPRSGEAGEISYKLRFNKARPIGLCSRPVRTPCWHWNRSTRSSLNDRQDYAKHNCLFCKYPGLH